MKSRCCFILLMIWSSLAFTQDYRFQVPRVEMTVLVLTDGSAAIGYDIDFRNEPGAHPIDIVDIGFPTEEAGAFTSYLNGEPVHNMGTSQYVQPGYEVHLPTPIPAGESGRFEFFMQVRNLVYQDVTKGDHASFQITPTWFGGDLVRGTTDLTIRIYLPPGVQPDEALFQNVEFTSKETLPWPRSEKWEITLSGSSGEGLEDYVTVVSFRAQHSFTKPYPVGVSFPKRVMSYVVPMTRWGLLWKWYTSKPTYLLVLLLIASAIVFLIGFHQLTGGTGMSCVSQFGLIAVFASFSIGKIILRPLAVYGVPILLPLGLLMLLISRFARRRYVPAMVSVEGGGIKRGLTAPEAAALLDLPAQKVAAMVVFGMLKKDVLRQVSPDPPVFDAGPATGVQVHQYEERLLSIVKAHPAKPASELDFGPAVKGVVTSLVAKMKDHNVDETKEYYRKIVSRAWEEVKEAGMDEVQWRKKLEDKSDWMMLDPGFNNRIIPFQQRYVSPSSSGVSIPSPSTPSTVGPGFSQVAAGFSGWMENTAGSLVATVAPTKEGLLNLGALDKMVESKGGGGSGGRSGGGGSCACACAGCACACACAGGGR